MDTTHHEHQKAWTSRPHFVPRQNLSAKQLNGIMEDELRRHRLLTRAMHGYGVVFGYKLKRKETPIPEAERPLDIDREHRIHISCGLILDQHGRELYWPDGWLHMCQVVDPPKRVGEYLLQAHYAERRDPADGCGPCPDDAGQYTEQTVVFTLTPGCRHTEQKCPPAECVDLTGYVCGRTGSDDGPIPEAEDFASIFCKEPAPLQPTACGEWRYAKAGVPIACVHVCEIIPGNERCPAQLGFCKTPPSVCSVRPFVYRNPLLFELIRGCHTDLAQVASLSWQDWLVKGWDHVVPWAEFKARFGSGSEGFLIWFTKPVAIKTLHNGSIFLTALIQEKDADYWKGGRIPIERMLPLRQKDGCAEGVQLIPEPDWVASEIDQRRSTLYDGVTIELTIRGQLVRDCCGRMLDARPVAPARPADPRDVFFLDPVWSGQARPGGDFSSAFRVGPNDQGRHPTRTTGPALNVAGTEPSAQSASARSDTP